MTGAEGVDLGDDEGILITFNIADRVVKFSSTFWPTKFGTVTGHISCPRQWFEEQPNTEDTYRKLFETKLPAFPQLWVPEACRQLAVRLCSAVSAPRC